MKGEAIIKTCEKCCQPASKNVFDTIPGWGALDRSQFQREHPMRVHDIPVHPRELPYVPLLVNVPHHHLHQITRHALWEGARPVVLLHLSAETA